MKRYFPIILLLALGAALTFGIVQLFELRFEVGDVYPEYSSLRSDALGTMAFYESLDRLSGLSVRRDFSTSNRLPNGNETAYFHLATSIDAWRRLSQGTVGEIEQFVNGGGRFVITMFPESSNFLPPLDQKKAETGSVDEKVKVTSLGDRWGVDFQIIDLRQADGAVYAPARVQNESALPLPETLDWHSGIVFANLDHAWKRIYTRGTNAVMIERAFGRGAVVIATDSYFLSNEAMRKDRHADLLAWLIGSSRNVIFDEAHLGVAEAPGVATLIRKYRLQWFIAGLILLAGLFVWKNTVSLVPPHAENNAQDYVPGKDSASGFDNLLRRSIPTRDLLAVCFSEWKKSAAQTGKYSPVRIQQAEAAFHAENRLVEKDRDPVRAYQTISRSLQTNLRGGTGRW